MSKLQLFLISLCFLDVTVHALKCFVCSTTQDDLDQRCVNDPSLVQNGVINCNKNYCTTIRIEYVDPRNKIQSIGRGCEDKPQFINQVLEDTTFRSYFGACQTDLCNGGSGKTFSGIGGLGGDIGDALVLLVPGVGFDSDSALSLSCNLFLIVIIAVSVLVYNV